MNSSKYEIKLRASINGVEKVPSRIAWIQGNDECLATPCYKENDYLVVKLIPDCVGLSCIEGYLIFDDTCTNCEPLHFKRCFCNTDADCPDCSQCDENYGICVDLCAEGEFCKDDRCIECDENNPCPNNLICINGGCQCPPNMIREGDRCVECTSSTNLGKCYECVNGIITPKCDKACIELTGECVDCVGHGDCLDRTDGKNCCSGNECGCCPGFEWDNEAKKCIPSCNENTCTDCERCTKDGCVPIQCPEGYKCYKGDCIYWPCDSESCDNGADCGPDCGCLDGECVPCYILECNGQCQDALGCKCNNLQKCEPVNNCGQYCDGNTPCLDQNCTCYNNECVSCENFPCDPDDCTGRYNCGCQDGDCTGGKGCNDKFELKKNTECSADGCELEAKYTTSHKCMCDPIEFKISNVYTQPTEQTQTGGDDTRTTTSGKILEFNTRLFKNNIPYENFRTIATMGDDELVGATIRTTITHRVNGNVVTPTVTQVNPVSVDGNNKIPNIIINNTHIAKTHNDKGTIVTIEVRAENVKVNSNGCTSYNSKVIATYELDYRSASTISATNIKINNTFQNEISTKVQDNDSIRKPLFVWFKSNTGTFGLNKYQNNGTYNQNGFFRKQYGVKGSDGWYDKISNPAKNNTGNQPHELWNNLNYRATVDCGCGGGSGATLQNVIFCCTENIDYTIQNCGKRITVPPFNVCSVNKNLTSLSTAGYTIPTEAQTFFWMIINGTKEVLLRQEGGEVINTPFVYDHDTNISSVAFEQRYKGVANTPVACNIEYNEDYVGPDYNISQECGKVTVTKLPSSPTIQSVTGKKGSSTFTFTPTNSNTVWTATGGVLSMNGEVEVTVNFQNSCSYTKKVNIVCQPEIKAVPTDTHARGECPGGKNPDVVVSVVAGFSSAVKFSKDGITYVDPDSTSPTIQKTFTNFPAGTHTFYAKETINGVEVIDTVDVVILPVLKPTISKKDICGNTQGSITIIGAAPQSTWKIFGPAYNGFVVSIGQNGSSPTVQIPIDKPGQYIAKLELDPSKSVCPQDIISNIIISGGNVYPTLITERSITCNGGKILFRIDDGGKNLTYNIKLGSPSNGILQDLDGNTISTLTANNTGEYNAQIIASNNSSLELIYDLFITSIVDGDCYLMLGAFARRFTVKVGPRITTTSISCGICQKDCYSVSVVVQGVATGVTIDGQNATQISPGVWSVSNIQTLGPIQVIAVNSSTDCGDEILITELPNCDGRDNCPPQTISISANPDSPTCGVQTVSLFYVYSTLGDIDGAEYLWYKTTEGIMQLLASGTISGTTVPQQNVTSSFTNETYALVIRTINGICEYTSNELTVFAQNTLSPEIFGAGISPDTTTLVTGQTYSYSTGFIPGATYTWTLSNANGSNQPVGTNSNAIQISSFTDGANTINLTVTDGICTGTASVTLNVGLSCPDVVLSLVGTGNDTCRGIGATVNNMPSGVTISSYAWYVNGVITTQTGSAPIVNFNTNVIEARDTADVTIEVTFSNGCIVESDDFEYTRCNCICSSSNACGSSQLYSLAMGTSPGTVTTSIGEFDSGSEFEWYLGHDGTAPIKYVFKLDGVTIRDTGIITRMASAGGCTTGSCPGGIQYLGDYPVDTVIMNAGATQLTGLTTATQVSGGCTRLINKPGVGFIEGTGANTITLGSAGFLTVEATTYSDVGCGILASQAILKLKCV